MIFFSDRTDGLGARLLGMLNATHMARSFDKEFRFTWSEREGVLALDHSIRSASTTFAEGYIEKHLVSDQDLAGYKIVSEKEFLNSEDPYSILNDDECAVRMEPNTNPLRASFLKKNGTPSIRYQTTYDEILFSESLEYARNYAKSVQLPERAVSIHLRAGDIIYGRYRFYDRFGIKALPAPLAEKIALIEKAEGRDVVLFGQDPELQEYLSKSSGALIGTDMRDGLGFDNEQQAIFDMQLMSRCEAIYGGSSMFCIVAALIGDIKLIEPRKHFSPDEIVDIIEEFAGSPRARDVNPLQVAFSCRAACVAGKQYVPVDERFRRLMALAKDLDDENIFYKLVMACSQYLRGEMESAERIIAEACLNFDKKNKFLFTSLNQPEQKGNPSSDMVGILQNFADINNPFAALLTAVANKKRKRIGESDKYMRIYYENCPPDLIQHGENVISGFNLPAK